MVKLSKRCLLTLGLILSINLICCKQVKFTKVECNYAENVVENVVCNVKQNEQKIGVLDMSGDLTKERNNITVNAALLMKRGPLEIALINTTESVCKIMSAERVSYYGEVALAYIGNRTNLIHECPYSGHLFLTEVNPNIVAIPSVFPNGDYILRLAFAEDQSYLGEVKIYINYQ